VTGHDKLRNSQLVLIYAAMHRLSELSRYEPLSFSGHFNVNHNWLLHVAFIVIEDLTSIIT